VNAQRVRELISVVTESEKYGEGGPRGPHSSAINKPRGTLRGCSGVRRLVR
jgi:hypothetical protein